MRVGRLRPVLIDYFDLASLMRCKLVLLTSRDLRGFEDCRAIGGKAI